MKLARAAPRSASAGTAPSCCIRHAQASTRCRTPVRSSSALATAARSLQQRPAYACQWRTHVLQTAARPRSRRGAGGGGATRVMVNVDFSPAVMLGIGVASGGLALLTVRRNQPYISRDNDVVIGSIAFLVGGILVFQGWRLDPLLLFGQLLTAGTATAFALEVFRLRGAIIKKQGQDGRQAGSIGRWSQPVQPQQQWRLPLPEEQREYGSWSNAEMEQQQAQPQEQWPDAYSAQQDAYDAYDDGQLRTTPTEDVQQPSGYGSGYSDDELGGGSVSGRTGGRQSRQAGGAYQDRNLDFDAVEDW